MKTQIIIIASLMLFAFCKEQPGPVWEFPDANYKAALQPLQPFQLKTTSANKRGNAVAELDLTKDAGYILAAKPESLSINVPTTTEMGDVLVNLTRNNIFTYNYKINTSSGKTLYDAGAHYVGKVAGKEGSWVAISFYNGLTMGMLNTTDHQLTIGNTGTANDPSAAVYKTVSEPPPGFTCATPDIGEVKGSELKTLPEVNIADLCIREWIEVNYDIVQSKGSVQLAQQYVTALWNQSIALSLIDTIHRKIAQIYLWDTPSPYTSTSCTALLQAFQQNRNNYDADQAILLGLQGTCGVASSIGGLCDPNEDKHMAYCVIQTTFKDLPDYSWSVSACTHEFTHVDGGWHTHHCGYTVNGVPDQALDGCAGGTEGPCPNPGLPVKGCYQSYCHLVQNVGIDLTLGLKECPVNGTGSCYQLHFDVVNTIKQGGCIGTCDGGPPPPPAPNKPPVTVITSPPDGFNCTRAFRMTISANAADQDGTVKSLYFYYDGSKIDLNYTNPPYILWVSQQREGAHFIYAIATDDDGATASSDTVRFTVSNAPPPPPPPVTEKITNQVIKLDTLWIDTDAGKKYFVLVNKKQ